MRVLVHSSRIVLVASATSLILFGCATKAPPSTPSTQSAPTASAPLATIRPGSLEDFRINVGDTVHFAYNQYELDDAARSALQRQAMWLQKYMVVHIRIEGDCDERGTREYNLALGARRADAVKEYLSGQGVSTSRIETISYGKEHPVCTESSEDCWAKNRRGVTTIMGGVSS